MSSLCSTGCILPVMYNVNDTVQTMTWQHRGLSPEEDIVQWLEEQECHAGLLDHYRQAGMRAQVPSWLRYFGYYRCWPSQAGCTDYEIGWRI